MFSKVKSSTVLGVDGTIISVEADVNDGLPLFTMVGYLSSSVKEAGERVRTALKNSGFHMPPKRITINLSPADIRKYGSGFDLPIAISVLLSMGLVSKMDMEEVVIVGELSLDGTVKPVPGILPMVHHAFKNGCKSCIVPYENAYEASLIRDIRTIGVRSLSEAVDYIEGRKILPDVSYVNERSGEAYIEDKLDFSDIKGQDLLKRGLEIAVSGFHNVLMTGTAGSGKSMLAKRLPGIMPGLSFEECIEITKIYSVSGMLNDGTGMIQKRPFRSPHHTISSNALTGGGHIPKPGEVSLAHNGVLFLDELPEFNRNVIEAMRQPLEDRQITISRVNSSYIFPADFMLVAAMNPCPCGNYPNMKKCTCTPAQIRRYQARISGPVLDRIDIKMEVRPISCEDIFYEGSGEHSSDIRQRVEAARLIQRRRYQDEGIHFNSQLDGKILKKYIVLGCEEQDFMKDLFERLELSARGANRVLKLARTIADMEGSMDIKITHLQEAAFFRNSGAHSDMGGVYYA